MLQSDLDLIRSCIDLAVRTSTNDEKQSHVSEYEELPEDHILEQFSLLCRKLQIEKGIKERCLIAIQNMILDTVSGLSWWEKTSRKQAAKYFSPDYCPGDSIKLLEETIISPAVSPLSEAMELSVLLNNRQDRINSTSTKFSKQELKAPGSQLPLTQQLQQSEPKRSQSRPSWRPIVAAESVPTSTVTNSPSTLRDDIKNLIEHYRYASPSDTHDPIPTPMRSPVELISPIASSNTALTVRSLNDLSMMRSSLPFATPPPPRPNRNLTFGESSVQPFSASPSTHFSQGNRINSTNKSNTNQKVSAIKGINNSQYLHTSSSTLRAGADLTRRTSTPSHSLSFKNISHNSSIGSIGSIGTNSSSTEVMTTMKLMLLFQRWIGKRSPNLSSTLLRMFSRIEETKSTSIILTELELWLQQKLTILLVDKIKGDIFNLWAKLSGESAVAREHHMHKMKRLGFDGLIDLLLRKRFDRKTALSHLAGTRKGKDRKGRSTVPSSPVDHVLGQGRVVTPALSYLSIFSRRYIKSKIKKMSKISRDAFARFQESVNLALTFRRFQRRITQWRRITTEAIKAAGKYNKRMPSIVLANSSLIAMGKALTYLSTYAKLKKRLRLRLVSLRNRLQGNRFCQRVVHFFLQPVFLRCFNEWKDHLVQGGLTQRRKQQYDAHHASARQQFAIGKWSKWTQLMNSQRQRISQGRPYNWHRSGTPVLKTLKTPSGSYNSSRNALKIAANFVVLFRAIRRLFIFSKNTKYFSSSLEMRLHKMVRSGGLNDRQKFINLSNASCLRILRFHDYHQGSNLDVDNRIIGLGRYSRATGHNYVDDHVVSDRSGLDSVVNNMKRYMVRDGGRTRHETPMTPRAMVALQRWVSFARSKQIRSSIITPDLSFFRKKRYFLQMKSILVHSSDRTSTASQRVIAVLRGKCEYYHTILRNSRKENHEKVLIGKLNEFLTIKSPIHGRQKRKQQDFEDWMSGYISENCTLTLSSIIGDSIAEMKLCRHTLRSWLKKRHQRSVEKNQIRSFQALLKMRAVVRWVHFSRNKLRKKEKEVKKIRLRDSCLRWRGLSVYRNAKMRSLKKYFKILKEKIRHQVCHRLWKRMYARKMGFCFRRWVEVTHRREAAVAMRESRCKAIVDRWIVSSAWASWMRLTKATALHRLSLLRLGWIRMSGFLNGFDSRSRSRSRGRLYVAEEYKRLGSLARAMVRLSCGRLGQQTASMKILRRAKNQMSNLTYLADIGSKRRPKRNIKHDYKFQLFSADESSIDFIAPAKIRAAKADASLGYRKSEAYRQYLLCSKYFGALSDKVTAKRKRRNTLTRYAFMQFVLNILERNQKQQIFHYAREFAVRIALRSAFLKMRVRVKRRQKIQARLGQAARFRTFRTWTVALTAFRAKCGLYHHDKVAPKKKLRKITARK